MKTCPKCKETKSLSEFNKNKNTADGLDTRCRMCRKIQYSESRIKVLSRKKKYHQENKIERNKKARRHYLSNKDRYYANCLRRQSIKNKAIPDFLLNSREEKESIRLVYKLRAVLSVATGVEHHVDHMWPLSDGGPHWSGNLQIITAQENLSKSYKVCKVTKKNIRDSLKLARKDYEDSSNGHRDGRTGSDKDMGDLHEGHQVR